MDRFSLLYQSAGVYLGAGEVLLLFAPSVCSKHVKVKLNNTTTVVYLNRLGMRCPSLRWKAVDRLRWQLSACLQSTFCKQGKHSVPCKPGLWE